MQKNILVLHNGSINTTNILWIQQWLENGENVRLKRIDEPPNPPDRETKVEFYYDEAEILDL